MALMRGCLNSARFIMKADVVKRGYVTGTASPDGEWVTNQDPITYEVIRQWVVPDQSATNQVITTIDCVVTSYAGTAGRNLNNTIVMQDEKFRIDEYLSISWPARWKLSTNDRITNIRNSKGLLLWDEGDHGAAGIIPTPTIFQLTGITPIVNESGNIKEYYSVIKRAELQ